MPFFSTSKASENPSLSPSEVVTPPPQPPREVLNVPAGNSEISAEPRVLTEADRRTGDTKQDLVAAFKVLRGLAEDSTDRGSEKYASAFPHTLHGNQHLPLDIGNIPCARQALLSGIVAAFGVGSISYIARRRPKSAANWAVGSFVGISAIMWENCRRARAKELAQMQYIQERYAHRHISKLRRKDGGETSRLGEEDAGVRSV
ncbi:hypothetical protein QFC20_001685 [Naganishia adeliensis]|uniref:Uncharacterized protein n=1 Tax=Naganishia adeliensis TaxID=92952 RepID=A0ACC2WSL8_9TREE|nr:hypothetical protein QFC20_001685 [Naganishia adeliensis]